MYQPLVPCPSCRRHVRTAEATCPFCGSKLSELGGRVIPNVKQRLPRGAVFVFASSIAVAGCGSDSTQTPTTTGDSATDTAKSETTGGDTPTSDSPVDTLDTGGVAPPYGIPSDSGPPDEGGGSADYGAPPPDTGK